MTKHEFYILNDLYNGRQGRGGCTSDIDRTRALDDQAAINALTDAGLIARDTGALTGRVLRRWNPTGWTTRSFWRRAPPPDSSLSLWSSQRDCSR